jgi:hypothetical protein
MDSRLERDRPPVFSTQGAMDYTVVASLVSPTRRLAGYGECANRFEPEVVFGPQCWRRSVKCVIGDRAGTSYACRSGYPAEAGLGED